MFSQPREHPWFQRAHSFTSAGNTHACTWVLDTAMHIFMVFLDFKVTAGANLHSGCLAYWERSLQCTDTFHARWNTRAHSSHSGYHNLFGNSCWCSLRMFYFSVNANLKTGVATWSRWVCHWLVEMMYHLDVQWGFCHWFYVNLQHLLSSVLVYSLYNPKCVVSVEYMLQKNWYPWASTVETDKSHLFSRGNCKWGG